MNMKPGILPARFIVLLLIILQSLAATAESLQAVSTASTAIAPAAGGGGDSSTPVLSADGRYVLFASSANNLALIGTNAIPDVFPAPLNVFWRDRLTATTRLVSLRADKSGGGNRDSIPTAISTNGQFALFESDADNLVPGDTNRATDVFIRDLVNDLTRIVSVQTNGRTGNNASQEAVMTPDGRYVAFVSAATDLVADDTNGIPDIFVRDLQLGTTTLVSVGSISNAAGALTQLSSSPQITPDGRYVAFYSTVTNLVPGATNKGGVYVRDLIAGQTIWVSAGAPVVLQPVFDTAATNLVAYNHQISADGRYVAYTASLTSGTLTARSAGCVLRYDRDSGATDVVFTNVPVTVVAGNTFGQANNFSLSPDGRFIAFAAKTNFLLATARCIRAWDAQTGVSTLVSGDVNGGVAASSVSDSPGLDATGRYVTFISNATNLTTNSLTGEFHLYRRDLQTGTIVLVNADPNGVGSPVDAALAPSLSADGNQLAFVFPDGTLVPNDRNHSDDVAVRDLASPTVELISIRQPTLPSLVANGFNTIYGSPLNFDGRYAVWVSSADDVVPGDTNGFPDVFVQDLQTGSNKLISVAMDGASANGSSLESSISADGRYVAFSSVATNLAAGDTNKAQDVFVRDLLLETTTLVSTRFNAPVAGNAASYAPLLSTNGQYVLFRSLASDLATPAFTGERLFWRDLTTSTNRRVSTLAVTNSEMTPDGRFVAYGVSPSQIFIWNSQIGTSTNASSVGGDLPFALSPDGRWLVYSANNLFRALNLAVRTNVTITSTNVLSEPRFSANSRFLAYCGLGGQIYLYDFLTASNRLVSHAFGSAADGNGRADAPAISADGRFVAYRSFADNIVPGDHNGLPDVYLYDRVADATTLVSVNRAGDAAANRSSRKPVFSGDGQTLVFQSAATDLIPGDFNQDSDVFSLRLTLPVNTDSDHDQMDDAWELLHFHTLARDGTGDFDHDGASDLFEFLTGTLPDDPNSLFRGQIIYSAGPGQTPVIRWPALPGHAYQIEFRNALDVSWLPLPGGISILGCTASASDPAPTPGQRYYRISLIGGN